MPKHRSEDHAHRFSAEGNFIERLEGPERRAALPREDIIPRMDLREDDIVVDLGSGIGYFSIPIAERVNAVISVDIEPKMHDVLSDRIRMAGPHNICQVRADITKLPIASGTVDKVLAAFVYHEVRSPSRLLKESARILSDHGKLTVIDFQKKETAFGPPVEERVTPWEVKRASSRYLKFSRAFDSDVYYQLEFTKSS